MIPGALLFAIPNGGGRTEWEAPRLRAEGVLAGVPDLLLAEPRRFGRLQYAGLFLEMKRPGRRPTQRQRRVGAMLRDRGYAVGLGDGLEIAWDQVLAYLGLGPPGLWSWGTGIAPRDTPIRAPMLSARPGALKGPRPDRDLLL